MIDIADIDRRMLERALELARRGRYAARPNPMVGAVLARGNEVLAEGWHARYGEVHAERMALAAWTGTVPADATLYVTLEPCAHQGKQPPCAELILERGVRRVVIAGADPTGKTRGIGPALLEQVGVEVVWADAGIAREAADLNAGFIVANTLGRPYVTCKWAMTSDGAFATGDPQRRWVSGEQARAYVQELRAVSGAVAIGADTAIVDDPLLTVRGALEDEIVSQPLRVVYDRNLRLPLDCNLTRVTDAPTLVVCGPDASNGRAADLIARGADVWRAPRARTLLADSLAELVRRGVNELLLESGPTLARAFHEHELIDRLVCFTAPFASTGDPALPRLAELDPLRRALEAATTRRIGADLIQTVKLRAVTIPAGEPAR